MDKNEPMEKLGVDQGQEPRELKKQASGGCPDCGGSVREVGPLLACVNCGTRPFEKRR